MDPADPEILYISSLVAAIYRSPTWFSPIAKFVDDNCSIFEDQEENKLEYTFIHNAFKQLIDELLEAHLQELSVTQEQFTRFCQHGLSGENEFHTELVEQLLSVDDFMIFKAMMVKRNAQLYRQALDMFGFTAPEASAPPPAEEATEDEEARNRLEAAELEAEKLELQRKCVEAELQLAMALSQQLKKRLELMEALSAVLEALADMKEGADAEAVAAMALEEAPMHVQPLYVVTDPAEQAAAEAEAEVQAAEAARQRERAEHAVAASRHAAAAREAAQPSAEERQKRAEHHKRQRDALLAKKNAERQQQFDTFKQTSGPTAAARAAEGALARQPVTGLTSEGQRLAAELSGAAPAPDPNAEKAAQESHAAEMRRMLTKQLKQTLIR